MIYYFRILENGIPNGYMGIAAAPNMEDMFWKIDEHCDPFAVEVIPANYTSVCWHSKTDGDSVISSEFELSEIYPLPELKGWRKPKWVINREKNQAS